MRGVGGSLDKVPASHPLVELHCFCLDPVRAGMAPSGPDHNRHVDQDVQVGPPTAGREVAGPSHLVEREPSPVALIRERRTGETVDNDVTTCPERRLDALAQVLCPGSEH